VDGCFSDARELLEISKPDVVHITTPPQSHFQLGRQCLEFGTHVYLEKPFTVTAEEAISLTQLAQERNLKITAGHNLQFTPEMLKMRHLVKQGFLGGKPVHVESHFSYELGDAGYVGALLGNAEHWVRQLPGQLFHNILSHGLAKLVEFLDGEINEVIAIAHRRPRLQNLPGKQLLDELRVLLRDNNGTTAFFCFTTQIKPGLNHLHIFGPRNSLMVSHVSGTVLREKGSSFKSYLTFFIPPLLAAREELAGAWSNVMGFLGRRLYQDFGMKELIDRFYRSVRGQAPIPIPYREIILTARIMDEIFAQIYFGEKPLKQTHIVKVAPGEVSPTPDGPKVDEQEPVSSNSRR